MKTVVTVMSVLMAHPKIALTAFYIAAALWVRYMYRSSTRNLRPRRYS